MTKYIGSAGPYGVFEKQLLSPDGFETEFPLIWQVGHANSLLVVSDGVVQEPNVSYSIANGGTSIVFSYPPVPAERIYIVYLGRELSVPAVAGNFPLRIRLTGGAASYDLLPYLPPEITQLREEATIVFVNGVEYQFGTQWRFDVLPDYKVGNQLNFLTIPGLGTTIDVYIHGIERSDLVTVDPGSITGDKLSPGINIGTALQPANTIHVTNLFADTIVTNYNTTEIELKSHIGFPNSAAYFVTAALSTNNASPSLLWEKSLPVDSMTWFEVDITGYNTTIDENVWFHLKGGIKRKAGVATIVGLVFQQNGTDNTTDYQAYAEALSDKLQVYVVGHPSSNPVHWAATIKYQSITVSA